MNKTIELVREDMGSRPPSLTLARGKGRNCAALTEAVKVKESEVAQSCPTLWDPMDCSPPGSLVHGIFQARVLEWVAIAFSIHRLVFINQNGKLGFSDYFNFVV